MQLSLFVESDNFNVSLNTDRPSDVRLLLELAEDRGMDALPPPAAAPVDAPAAEAKTDAAAPAEEPKPKKSHKKKEPAPAAAAAAEPPAEEKPADPPYDPEKEKADTEYLKYATRVAGAFMVSDREGFQALLKKHGVERYREFAGDIGRIRPFIESCPLPPEPQVPA